MTHKPPIFIAAFAGMTSCVLWVTLSAFAADVSFDPQILERYVGYYQADPKTRPDTMVDVSRAGDRLTIQIPGHPKNTLTPLNERQFSFYRSDEQVTAHVTFPARKPGPAEKFTLRQNGVDTVMTRINVKAALEVADRAMLNAWFSSAAGLSSAPDPGVPLLPTWRLVPRTATSVPLGTALLDQAPAAIATIPLAKHGYVEEEYFISGRGNVYAIGGKRVWRADLPYTTRILVRRPAAPKTFSGTVHMEAARDGSESTATLMDIWPLAVRDGDVFVTWTMSKDNVPALLKEFDAARYAALDIPANGLRWDIMAQTAWLLRSPEGPLGKLGFIDAAAKRSGGLRLYSTGAAQAAEMQALFVNEGFHMRARTPSDEPVIDAYVPVMNIQRIPPQDDAFIMRIMTETEFDNPGTYDQPGAWVTRPAFRGAAVNLREYHIAGVSHADWHNQPQFSPVFHQLGMSAAVAPKCTQPIARTSGKSRVTRALYEALNDWVRHGRTPPNNRLFLLDPDHRPVRDPNSGNVVGSLRPYWINIPTARFAIDNRAADDSPASAACRLYGYQEPFSKARLGELYKDRAEYLERVAQHLGRMVQQRYLLPEDALAERELVEKSTLP
ncbi:MAG: hypothetical protein K2P94_09655 [Rhodospirillaceae bacterium]|nr:hypothetical protein [Rhodospirillaceae bacterium]